MAEQHPPIVCTLEEDARPAHEAECHELFSSALVASERTQEGVRLRFHSDDDVEEQVRDLARREKERCAFFEFHVVREADEVRLDWSGPADAQSLLDQVYAEASTHA